jgi:hypothetical protein
MVRRAFAATAFAGLLPSVVGCNSILGIDDHPWEMDAGAMEGGPVALVEAGPPDVMVGPPGCFQGTPSTDTEFFNRCTTAQYKAFDNCNKLALCDGGVPPLVDPPDASAASTDSGAPTPPAVGCYDATTRNKLIFMQGSTNFPPFIKAMAPLVAMNGYVIVWQPTNSCTGAGAGGFDTTPGKNLMKNPTLSTQTFAAFYDATGNATPCLLGNSPTSPDGKAEITDIGQSDVFGEVCPLPAGQSPWVPGTAAYPDVGHYLGPVQSMMFVTPPQSTQRAISAEAARMVFGMGGNNGITVPWTDPAHMLIRSPSTGTNNILSRAIDVPNNRWWGVDTKTASAMQTAILTASTTDAERTIGTLSIDYADKVKDSLHILFFQAKGQLAGFLPDSSPLSHDKQNVRDGHYAPWGPIHLYSKLVGGQASAQAAAFIQPFTVPNQALIDATIAGGAVPVCAMHVQRNQEMGPLQAFSPMFQCNCYYDFKVSGENQCKPCSGPAVCPPERPACNLGYCEAAN